MVFYFPFCAWTAAWCGCTSRVEAGLRLPDQGAFKACVILEPFILGADLYRLEVSLVDESGTLDRSHARVRSGRRGGAIRRRTTTSLPAADNGQRDREGQLMTIAGFDRRDLRMVGNLFKLTLTDRYLGSALGLAWAVLSPLLLMGIFIFVFAFVFPGRLQGREGALPYIIWLLSGYGPWLAIAEGLSVSTISVVSNAGIIKNIAFKSEVLPVVGALTGILPLLVSLGLILILQLIAGELPSLALAVVARRLRIADFVRLGLGAVSGGAQRFRARYSAGIAECVDAVAVCFAHFLSLTAYPTRCSGGPAVQSRLRDRGLLSCAYTRWHSAAAVDVRLHGGRIDSNFRGLACGGSAA